MITAERVERWRRLQWCVINRQFGEDWEVTRWKAVGKNKDCAGEESEEVITRLRM